VSMARLAQLFAYHYPPSNASAAARLSRFARYLPEHGYRCRVVACRVPDSGSSREVVYVGLGDSVGLWKLAWWVAKGVQRLAPYNDRLDWIPAAIYAAIQQQDRERASAVLSSSPPLATHLAAAWVSSRYRLPWVADFQDPLADNPFRERLWGQLYDRLMEHWIFGRAAVVLANTEPVAERWRSRYPFWAAKFRVLPNGFDPAEPPIRPAPQRDPRLIVHAGSLYGHRRPTQFMRVWHYLASHGWVRPGEWQAAFVGPASDHPFRDCARECSELQRAGLVILEQGSKPKAVLRDWIQRASALLLLDLVGRDESLQIPAKLFDYVRSGIPIVAWSPLGSPTRSILERSGVPCLLVDPREPVESVAVRLGNFLVNIPEPSPPGSWFLETFDGRRQVAQLANVLDVLLERGHALE